MKRICLFAMLPVIALSAGASLSLAQQDGKPVPRPPYVAAIPVNGHWSVTLDASDPQAPAGTKAPLADEHVPTSIDTIKVGNTKRVTLFFKDGTSRRFDQVDGYFLTASPAGAKLFVPMDASPPYPFYTDGFLFVDHVNPSTFKGVVTCKGVDCFHYQDGSLDIWIAVDSMLPVAAESGKVTAYFQFMAPPDAPITLPADEELILQKEIGAYNKFRAVR
jgi:hypothetical protein